MPADLLVLHMKSDAGCLQSIHLSMMASAVPRKRRADLPLCWDLAQDLLKMGNGRYDEHGVVCRNRSRPSLRSAAASSQEGQARHSPVTNSA